MSQGEHQVLGPFIPDQELTDERYLFWCIIPEDDQHDVTIHGSEQRGTGLLSLRYNRPFNQDKVGGENMTFWIPERRPGGHNVAFTLATPVDCMQPTRVQSGGARPTSGPQAWVADPTDTQPELTLQWQQQVDIQRIEIALDVDYDHAMESAQWDHCDRVIPFVVKDFTIEDEEGQQIAEITDNHHGLVTIDLPNITRSKSITLKIQRNVEAPTAIHRLRVYGPQ